MGELGMDGLNVGDGGEGGRQAGTIRRSSFDILICCSTTASFNSPRCACPLTYVNTVFNHGQTDTIPNVPQDPRPGPEERPSLR